MTKKKILFLLHLPPPVHGSSMVGKWIKESEIINDSFKCSYVNLLASKQVHQTGRVTVEKIIGMFSVFLKLINQLILEKPNLCYLALTTTGIGFYRDVILVFLLRVFRVKRVFHLHNKGVKGFAQKGINKILYKFAFKNARVIILSSFLYDDINEFVPLSNVEICYNGIPFDSAQNRENQEVSNKKITILFLSNLIESKGVFVLLHAISLLKRKKINVQGVFVGGEGDIDKTEFERKVEELMIGDSVSYLGKKYNKEKDEVFKSANIFVLPTFYSKECFPLVLLEAMSFGLPIISTEEGGIKTIIEDGKTGYIVPKKDEVELANRLENLINLPEKRKEMGIKGKERFLKEFTLINFENRLLEILNKSLK